MQVVTRVDLGLVVILVHVHVIVLDLLLLWLGHLDRHLGHFRQRCADFQRRLFLLLLWCRCRLRGRLQAMRGERALASGFQRLCLRLVLLRLNGGGPGGLCAATLRHCGRLGLQLSGVTSQKAATQHLDVAVLKLGQGGVDLHVIRLGHLDDRGGRNALLLRELVDSHLITPLPPPARTIPRP